MTNNIAIAGCGNVGTALLEILNSKSAELREKYGFEFKVVLINDLMKGVIADPAGLDLAAVTEALHTKHSLADFPQAEGSFEELLDLSGATVLAECTPTNVKTGEPGLSHIKAALSRGINVTTTNKGPIAVAFDELKTLAAECGAKLSYEGVVMSGTPLISMLEDGMAGCSVLAVEGILNGTTNYILTKMAEGKSYSEALAEATALGYAEADPSGDVEGWDAAAKVAILARLLFNESIAVSEVEREGITKVTEAELLTAAEKGNVIKLIAGLKKEENQIKAFVKPMELPRSNPLASIGGAVNAATVITDHLGAVTLTGPGAGRTETGQALLGDIIRMSFKK